MCMNRNHATISMEFLHPKQHAANATTPPAPALAPPEQKTFSNDLQNFSSQMVCAAVVVIARFICCCCCRLWSSFFHSYLQIIRMLWRAMLCLWFSLRFYLTLVLWLCFFNLFCSLCSHPTIHLSIHPYWSVCRLAALVQATSASSAAALPPPVGGDAKKLKTTGPILIILNFHANNAFDFNFVRETQNEKGVPIKNSTIRNCLMARTQWMKIRYSLNLSLSPSPIRAHLSNHTKVKFEILTIVDFLVEQQKKQQK